MYRELFCQLLARYVVDACIQFKIDNECVFVGTQLAGQRAQIPNVIIRITREGFFSRVLSYGNLGLGEAYIDQDFEVEHGSLQEFLTILLRNRLDEKIKADYRLLIKIAAIQLTNVWRGKPRNVRRHY